MDAPQFDALSKALSGAGARRRVLGALVAVPALGGLAGLLGRDEADGRKRRAKHGHSVDAEKKKKKKKKKCQPLPTSTICAGKCGSAFDNCKQTVNCGSCDCSPACGECSICQGAAGAPGICVPRGTGTPCGADATCANGLIQPKSSCNGSGECVAASPVSCAPYAQCDGNACPTKCTTGAECMAGAICNASSQCVTCDVCASGCTFTTIQAAINAAIPGATVVICPGSYGRTGSNSIAVINKTVTLVGAGRGEGGSILDGGEAGSDNPLVQVVNAQSVELRDLWIKRGKTTSVGGLGGGLLVASSSVTLRRVQISNSSASRGGGIYINNESLVTLVDTSIKDNSATVSGGGIYNGGSLARFGANELTGNSNPQCTNAPGSIGCP